jgi:hypothetical protein
MGASFVESFLVSSCNGIPWAALRNDHTHDGPERKNGATAVARSVFSLFSPCFLRQTSTSALSLAPLAQESYYNDADSDQCPIQKVFRSVGGRDLWPTPPLPLHNPQVTHPAPSMGVLWRTITRNHPQSSTGYSF